MSADLPERPSETPVQAPVSEAEGWRRRIPARLLWPAASLALALLFLWQTWAPKLADRMHIGPADGDFLRQFLAYRAFVARAWAFGKPPLWNPHQYAGSPAWADPQQAVLYPWRLLQIPLAWFFDPLPLWALNLEVAAHIALAGLFTALLLRALGAGRAGAALAGLGFALGGYLSGYPLEQLAILDTAVWLPALLWALTLALDAVRAGRAWHRPALLAALAGAMMLLAGHPQTALYGLWATLAWWVWRGWRLPLWPGLVAFGGALGLSAAQWLPSLDLLRRSSRAIDAAEIAAGYPPRDLLQLLAPGAWDHWAPLYVGVLPLALALWAAWRLRESRPWLALSAGAWLIGLGGNSPVFPLLLRVLPGMGLFRHQERIALLFSLGLAVAAGLALDRLLRGPLAEETVHAKREVKKSPTAKNEFEPRASRDSLDPLASLQVLRLLALIAGASALSAAILYTRYRGLALPLLDACQPAGLDIEWTPLARRLALADPLAHSALIAALGAGLFWLARAGRISRRGLAILLLCLLTLDLFDVNQGRALCPAAEERLARDANLETLLPLARNGRVSSEARLPGGPNAASLFGLYDVTGDSPLQLGSTAALVEAAPEILWWRLLGVRYLISARPPESAPLHELARAGEAALYAVELPAPPAWIPSRTYCLDVGEASSAALSDDFDWSWARADLDPQLDLFVELAPEDPIRAEASCEPAAAHGAGASSAGSEASSESPVEIVATAGDEGRSQARLSGLDPGHIQVEAELGAPGWLVLSTAYDPAWRVSARELDSGERLRPAAYRAYGSVMAVWLPAGRWAVGWTYLPAAVIMGLLVSALTLGAGIWLWLRPETTS